MDNLDLVIRDVIWRPEGKGQHTTSGWSFLWKQNMSQDTVHIDTFKELKLLTFKKVDSLPLSFRFT